MHDGASRYGLFALPTAPSPARPAPNLVETLMRQLMPEIAEDTRSKRPIVRPVRLTDQVTNVIKQMIFAGELNPGDRVVEQKIARDLGVGQNAVREALISLSHMGFVRRVPNVGTYITELSRADAEKISLVRTSLESLVIDLVAKRLQKENLNLSGCEDLLRRMREAVARGDLATFYDCDLQLHRMLWALADNVYLSQLLEQIVVPLFAFFVMLTNPSEKATHFLEAVKHHENVVKALSSQSPQRAHAAFCDLMTLSLRQQKEIIGESGKSKKPTVKSKSALNRSPRP